jgi:hypothetical protein
LLSYRRNLAKEKYYPKGIAFLQKLISHLAVERFAVSILPGTSGFDVESFNANVFEQFFQFPCNELRSIV